MNELEQLFDKIAANATYLWSDSAGEIRVTRLNATRIYELRWFVETRIGDGGDEDILYAEGKDLERALLALLGETEQAIRNRETER